MTSEWHWFKRRMISKSLISHICAYYSPPSDTEFALDSLEEALEEVQTLLYKKACVIVAIHFNDQV